jgi:cytochrome c oxidase cbb3-type subunit I
MLNPFLLMAVFYLAVALLGALISTFANAGMLPWFGGLPWLRAHLVTLGVLTEAAFGVLPLLVARRRGAADPPPHWATWVVLNAGLVLLLAGMPGVVSTLIIAGGTLVFVAAIMLAQHLRTIGAGGDAGAGTGSARFYPAGLAYLLVGILIGTGLWVGWSEPLRIAVPKEAHVHANAWGFASLVFAGLLVDLFPALAARPLASRRTIDAIFWLMTLGALGLVLGPWLGGNLWVTIPGLVMHIAATVWLLGLAIRALRRTRAFTRPGAWHLALSYTWILLPIAMAPFVVFGMPGLPGGDIEAIAPQALIYGWMFQFLIAAVPFFLARWLLRDRQARLGGTWLSLAAVNLGSVLIWVGIFLADLRGPIHAAAYAAYAVALLAALWESGIITREALRRAEPAAQAVLSAAD